MSILQQLREASRDLLFPSERDHPLEVFGWEHAAKDLDNATLMKLAGKSPCAFVERADVDDFFKNVVVEQDWHGELEKQDVQKFQHLVRLLKGNLRNLRVFRVGKIEVDIYVVGMTDSGECIGFHTKLVET